MSRSHGLVLAISSLIGVGWMLGCVYLAGSYGPWLFISAPVAQGAVCAFLCESIGIRTRKNVFSLTACSIAITGCLLIVGHLEGVVCLAMALPLAIPLALFGAWVTRSILTNWRSPRTLAPLVLAPFFLANSSDPGLHAVESQLEIAAPPELVWRNVVEFSDLPAPHELLFKTGLAYPERARIVGRGVGAVRYCEFSTGAFVEPIRVWDEPRLLRFAVTENPEPLRELTLYKSLHPPHLNGYFVSREGQFLLELLPNGHTLLRGTSWYELHMGPGPYWRLWSDYIIHQIHRRVLEHIRTLAEANVKQPKL